MLLRSLRAICVCASILSAAGAEEPAPKLRLTLMNVIGGRINPLGLEDQFHLGPAIELYPSPRAALHDNFLYFGLAPKLSPSRIRVGAEVEVQPLSIFNLRVVGELVSYFNFYGQLQSFGSPLDGFSDSVLSRGEAAGLSYRADGVHVMIQPTLQLKLGPIALVDRLSVEYWSMNLRQGDRVFYEGSFDTLISRDGWALMNDVDLVYLTRIRLIAGVRYTVMQPFYRASDYRPGDDFRLNPNRMQRLGPVIAYTVFEKPRHGVRSLTIGLVVGWYLEQRWRTGFDVSPALPSGTLALWFYSDLTRR